MQMMSRSGQVSNVQVGVKVRPEEALIGSKVLATRWTLERRVEKTL